MTLSNQVPIVGIMAAGAPGPVENFKTGMRDCGFVEGETVRYELRVAHGDAAKLPHFADELVRASVNLMAVVGAVTARAARSATQDVPIVYAVVVDPVSDDLATLPGQPLSNMTGVTTFDPNQAPMHLALLRTVNPALARIAILADDGVSDCLCNANTRAADEIEVRSHVVRIAGPDPDLASVFAAMLNEGAEALVVLEHPINGANARRIAELSLAHGLPTVVARAQAESGGLFGYGTSLRFAANQMARLASSILRGNRPSDLPVETFHRPELVVNMQTARGLGLVISQDILNRAVRVIA